MRLSGQAGGRSVHLIGIGLGTLAAPVLAAVDPAPPPLATPPPSGNVPLADGPRVESAPALPAVPAPPAPAGSVPPLTVPPAAAAPAPASPSAGLATVFAALLGLGLAAGAALSVRRWQERRKAARAGGLPGTAAPARGVPAKERINR